MNYIFVNTTNGVELQVCWQGQTLHFVEQTNTTSTVLLPQLDCMLQQVGAEACDMDVFGVCVGPGSFTGIRVGIATVKAFGQACGKDIIAVTSLRLNAYNVEGRVASMVQGGGNIRYVAVYERGICLHEPVAMELCDLQNWLCSKEVDSVVSGVQCVSVLTESGGEANTAELNSGQAQQVPLETVFLQQRISSAMQDSRNKRVNYVMLEPLYIRRSQAERTKGEI